MRNVTVTVQDRTYHQIRAWCAQRDTCISHVVRAFLEDLPRLQDVRRFPLPEAPDPRSLGALFNRLDMDEIDRIQLQMQQLGE